MIRYTSDAFQLRFICKLRGSVLPRALVFSIPAAFLAVLLSTEFIDKSSFIIAAGLNASLYGSFSSILGFFLVFRTSQALGRFMDGLQCMYSMSSQWCEACSSLVIFSESSSRSRGEIDAFQHLIVRLFSLLHGFSLREVSGRAFDAFETLNVAVLDNESVAFLLQCDQRGVDHVSVVHAWIQKSIIDKLQPGGILAAIPAPILSRVFQELSDGMNQLQGAMKLVDVPLPFPYVQMTSVLLIFHWFITPFFCCAIAANPSWAGIYAFVMITSVWSINFIAAELEQPFQKDLNDLPMIEMQEHTLKILFDLLDRRFKRSPFLSATTTIDTPMSSQRFSSRSLRNSAQFERTAEETKAPDSVEVQVLGASTKPESSSSIASATSGVAQDGLVSLEISDEVLPAGDACESVCEGSNLIPSSRCVQPISEDPSQPSGSQEKQAVPSGNRPVFPVTSSGVTQIPPEGNRTVFLECLPLPMTDPDFRLRMMWPDDDQTCYS